MCDLLGRNRVAEKSQPQPVPLATVAAALDGVQRVGAEDRQRWHLVEFDRLHRPLQLHGKRHRTLLTTASFRARRVPVSSGLSSGMSPPTPRRPPASPSGAAGLEQPQHLRVTEPGLLGGGLARQHRCLHLARLAGRAGIAERLQHFADVGILEHRCAHLPSAAWRGRRRREPQACGHAAAAAGAGALAVAGGSARAACAAAARRARRAVGCGRGGARPGRSAAWAAAARAGVAATGGDRARR